jgi:multidrug efflux pump subunit AcrA (membrane-fusion protein)
MFFKYGIPAIAAGALAFAVLSVRHMKPQQVEAAPPLAPPSSEFERQIGGIGMVEAASENISIGTPVPGLVSAVYVRAGQAVRRGQPLMRLDDRDLGAELALRDTAVRVAEARLQRLRNAPRPEDIPPAEARLEQARAQLADAEAQLRIIEAVPTGAPFAQRISSGAGGPWRRRARSCGRQKRRWLNCGPGRGERTSWWRRRNWRKRASI